MRDFISRHGHEEFPYSEELLAAIRAGACVLSNKPGLGARETPIRNLLYTYRRRLKHLEKFSTQHALVLRKDTAFLCEQLQNSGDSGCQMWTFEFQKGRDITVFEGSPSGEILGCIKTVDQRKVSEEEWKTLWGAEGQGGC